MRGNDRVFEQLNAGLRSELTAIVQYMVQAEMAHNSGYERLAHLTKKRAIEEMRHAESFIERILFLGGTPAVNVPLVPKIDASIREHLETDLGDEIQAVEQYNHAVKVCSQAGDAGSRELFERIIQDEEKHTDFLKEQLHAIEEMGVQNYLSEQVKGAAS